MTAAAGHSGTIAAVLLAFASTLLAADLYVYTAPDGTVVLTDSPRHAGFDLWWRDTVPGRSLPNGVPMPRLDRIANLDSYDRLLLAAAGENGLPAELLKAVAVAESRMNPNAVSPAGARGLMQIIPSTARALGVTDPFDPAQSIAGGAAYLARQVAAFGRYELALAAYNAGPEAVRRHDGVPPYEETRTYVARVMGLYEHFRAERPVVGPAG
jgi:soluble lytic murein transglycosylase-like protein